MYDEKINKKKIVEYLINEIEYPRVITAKGAHLNLLQKITYGDFDNV